MVIGVQKVHFLLSLTMVSSPLPNSAEMKLSARIIGVLISPLSWQDLMTNMETTFAQGGTSARTEILIYVLSVSIVMKNNYSNLYPVLMGNIIFKLVKHSAHYAQQVLFVWDLELQTQLNADPATPANSKEVLTRHNFALPVLIAHLCQSQTIHSLPFKWLSSLSFAMQLPIVLKGLSPQQQMLEAPSLLKNVKLVHIVEREPKILTVKVSVGLVTIALLILQNHCQQSQDFSLKGSETKSKSLAVLVHIRMNLVQLNANIVQKEVNAQINR